MYPGPVSLENKFTKTFKEELMSFYILFFQKVKVNGALPYWFSEGRIFLTSKHKKKENYRWISLMTLVVPILKKR